MLVHRQAQLRHLPHTQRGGSVQEMHRKGYQARIETHSPPGAASTSAPQRGPRHPRRRSPRAGRARSRRRHSEACRVILRRSSLPGERSRFSRTAGRRRRRADAPPPRLSHAQNRSWSTAARPNTPPLLVCICLSSAPLPASSQHLPPSLRRDADVTRLQLLEDGEEGAAGAGWMLTAGAVDPAARGSLGGGCQAHRSKWMDDQRGGRTFRTGRHSIDQYAA